MPTSLSVTHFPLRRYWALAIAYQPRCCSVVLWSTCHGKHVDRELFFLPCAEADLEGSTKAPSSVTLSSQHVIDLCRSGAFPRNVWSAGAQQHRPGSHKYRGVKFQNLELARRIDCSATKFYCSSLIGPFRFTRTVFSFGLAFFRLFLLFDGPWHTSAIHTFCMYRI